MEKDHNHSDDTTLWESVRLGSERAFEQLYRRYFQDLFRYGKQFLADDAAVDDAIQDLFVDLWRTRRSLGQARSVKYYLMVSLRRKIHRSHQSDAEQNILWENLPESLLPTQPSTETSLTLREEGHTKTQQLRAWLDRLPPRQREALVLRYYHNFEYSEIASLLTIKEQTSRNLVQKALHTLRKIAIYLVFIVLEIIF